MELFCFDDDVGPGLPLWLPKGAVLIEELEKLAKETEFAAGYVRVRTPHIARESMYVMQRAPALLRGVDVSSDASSLEEEEERAQREELSELNSKLAKEKMASVEMVTVSKRRNRLSPGYRLRTQVDNHLPSSEIDQSWSQRYYLKAMNCPHHHKIFAAVPHSYRDLAAAPGGIRHLLSLRTKRRAFRPDARALASNE